MTVDPYTVACGYCQALAGTRCGYRSFGVWHVRSRPHQSRARDALALAAHTDAALDAFFPRTNPCGVCGWLPQRHRRIDTIAGALEAGETEGDIAAELEVSMDAVMAVTAWAAKYPGAWK